MSKKKIRVSEVLDLLAEGKKRPEIAKELDITMADCRKLFQHPKLKGKKALKPTEFVLEDDTEEEEAIEDQVAVNANDTDDVASDEVRNEEEDSPVNSDEAIEEKATATDEEEDEVKQGTWED